MNARQISIAFQTDKTPSAYIELAQLVNQYDFDAVSVYCDLPFQPSYGPLLLMAPHLKRACLGPAGIAPSRIHPLDIASQTALLAHLAQGGVYIGLVRGAWLEEHGIKETKPSLSAIHETVDIVRALLAGKMEGYAGEIYQITTSIKSPYPLPDGPIPVMIGTWGAKLAALAGEIADEVKIGGSANPDMVPVMQSYIEAGEKRAGRTAGSVGIVMGAVTVVDEDRQAARQLARYELALYLPVVAALDSTLHLESELIQRLQYHARQHDNESAARLISDDVLDRFAFSGNADDIIRQSEALFAAGARRIEFGTPHGLKAETGIRLLGEKIIPALKNS